ncbi:MAG: PH domain-containing protein [Planctomycetota bacterium]
MDGTDGNRFAIQRKQVARYFYWTQILIIVVVGIWFLGAGLILAIIHAFTLGPWLSAKQAQALSYWLDGGTLRVDQGVFFLKRKAVPLDRVTDVVLAQGPLMRLCGIWELRVQTAGTGQAIPEATLYGVAEPEKVRDTLLTARDKAVSREN